MEKSATEGTGDKPDNAATRLMERLKSPLLQIASQLPSTESPHSRISVSLRVRRQVAAEVEYLSVGRFSLANDQQSKDKEWTRHTRIKVVHHTCQRYSWLSLAQIEAYGGSKKCCCYCSEPLSLDHIGTDLSSIQRFTEIRSGGKVRFSDSNNLEEVDLNDVFLFQCISPCRGLEYDLPFVWFLRDSKPGSSFDDTCGCPCCNAKLNSTK